MRIVFDPSSLEQGSSPSRSIIGVVYFEFASGCFPGSRWDDFAVVITSWWLDALSKLERGVDSEIVLRFMDGPYYIVVRRLSDDQVQMRCIEDRRDAGEPIEEQVALSALAEQIRGLARDVVLACDRAGMRSRDLDGLKRHFN